MPNKKSRTTRPDLGSLEMTEEVIRQRAYGYYEQRGREDGHDLEDWFRAEAEILGTTTRDARAEHKVAAKKDVAA